MTVEELTRRLAEAERERDEAIDGECQRAVERDEWRQAAETEASLRRDAMTALARCREVLRRVGYYEDAPEVCRVCGYHPGIGLHAPDCALKAALAD